MLNLMYITNDPRVAAIADRAGVDRIFLDLETVGKAQRQGGMDTVQSHHTPADVGAVRPVLNKAELLVRLNPIYPGTGDEIESVLDNGVDVLMLPYFKTAAEVETFLRHVNGRAKTMLLFETPEAVEQLEDILALPVDEYHIGLNDLHLGYGKRFMFQLLADGTAERICRSFAKTGRPYGFGGIAGVGAGTLPAELIIGEHVRLGSSRAILARSFCNTQQITDYEEIEGIFQTGIPKIRAAEEHWRNCTAPEREENRLLVGKIVEQIVERM